MQSYNKSFEKLVKVNSYNFKNNYSEKLFKKIFSELYIHHIKNSKIYFETLASDSTISLFEKNSITTFDLSQKKIIIESSEKNILDFFAYKNFENASLIKVEKKNEFCG